MIAEQWGVFRIYHVRSIHGRIDRHISSGTSYEMNKGEPIGNCKTVLVCHAYVSENRQVIVTVAVLHLDSF